jgi:phenylacetate-CoA ligase
MLRLVSNLWWRRNLSRNALSYTELQTFPSLSAAAQRDELARRLLDQIQYFGAREDALPEWREAARIRSANDLWRLWPSLPIIGKSHLQTQFIATETKRLCGLPGKLNATGGSTGEAVHFYHDERMIKSSTAAGYYTRCRMGWKPGMATIIVWGSERDIRKHVPFRNRMHSRLLNDHIVDGYNLTDETVRRVEKLARRHRPAAIYGFTSMLAFVAERLQALGIVLPPGCIAAAWNGGEMLYPEQTEIFRKVFGTPILNRYGGRELSSMACQFEDGAPLHVLRPWVFLEIVNDAGQPVAPGESGRLIWTSTVCRGTPFLRFEVGDLGASRHVNESGVFAIDELHGRTAGLLKLASGRTVSNLYWNHLFKECPEVQQFQVILLRDGNIRILLRGSGFTPEREARVRNLIEGVIGPVSIDFRWVDRIPLTAQGKRLQVTRER